MAITIEEFRLVDRVSGVDSQRGGWASRMVGQASLRAAEKAWAA
jgi:hypothetical protein